MTIYKYVAKDDSSKRIRGKADVENRKELVAFLRSQDLYLLHCHEVIKEQNTKKLKTSELSVFSREIGTMLDSGISLIRAISIMLKNPDISEGTQKIYKDIYVKLQQGEPLSNAMQAQIGAFPDVMINMYRAGETSGQMSKTAMVMAKQYEKENKLRNTIKTATTYPMILIVVSIFVILIIFGFVLPQFFVTFTEMKVALPGITKFMLYISKALKSYWYIFIIVILISIVAISMIFRTPPVRYQFDKFKLRFNKRIGNLLKIIYTARFARTLCSLYSSGMSIINALLIIKSTINNSYIESQFDNAIREVRNGTTLSQAIAKIDGFSLKLSNSIYVGEESGRLDIMLETLADDFDYEAEQATQKLITYLEPALIVFLGIFIGAVLISVMLPIYSIYSSAGKV